MRTITFYGTSDDLIQVRGPLKGCDEYNTAQFEAGGADSGPFSFLLASKEGRMRVHAIYDAAGCWAFAPGVAEAGESLPMWAMRFQGGVQDLEELTPDYSTRLDIEVPTDTRVFALLDGLDPVPAFTYSGANF